MSKHRIFGIASRSIFIIILVITAYYLLVFSIPLLYPFLIGWIIAMLIEPIIRVLDQKCKIPRLLGSFLVLFLLLSLLLTSVIFLIAGIVVELTNLAQKLPSFFNDLGELLFQKFVQQNTMLTHIMDTIQSYLQKNPSQQASIQASIQENLSALTKQGTMLITDIISGIGSFLGNLPYLITVLVFITLATFFISLKWPRMNVRIQSMVPESIRQTSGSIMSDLKKALVGFIRAQLTLITISSLIMYIGLLILQVPYAISIALIIGIVDLLPYLGVGAVLVPWIIYLFFIGNFHLAIGLSIVYLVILITRQSIEPKLVATSVGLDPLVTLIALFIGLNLLGVLGFVVGPTVAVIIIALHKAHIFQDVWNFILNGKKTKI
ncbi:sporulation integral membrane protein YtvI [Shimazuella kribbensis]|uniref:sporulation integral membrane protein YtvI n=1 Tax=Shimazuella kribbensis TaxID=139808 RepID=UPI000406A30E|nr:sporulation integral membrane protein YtvI [Shimazuella kribbensis]